MIVAEASRKGLTGRDLRRKMRKVDTLNSGAASPIGSSSVGCGCLAGEEVSDPFTWL